MKNNVNLVLIPFGLPGKVYRSPMPFGTFDFGHSTFAEMQQADLHTVVMLTDHEEDQYHAGRDLAKLYKEQGWQVLHLPVADFDVPENVEKLLHAVASVYSLAKDGKNVAVHCYAGRGRTGLFLALLVRRVQGVDGITAVKWLRQYFPAVETEQQLKLVVEAQFDDMEESG